jgi:hypothetical protein
VTSDVDEGTSGALGDLFKSVSLEKTHPGSSQEIQMLESESSEPQGRSDARAIDRPQGDYLLAISFQATIVA